MDMPVFWIAKLNWLDLTGGQMPLKITEEVHMEITRHLTHLMKSSSCE